MTVSIPRTKKDRDWRYDRRDHNLPAINVKYYGRTGYTPEKIAEHFGCDEATAERAAQWCYESAVEQFWEQALDSLNFAMLGDEKASHLKPCGLNDGPYEIFADGRMGGWLVVRGLGDIAGMSGATFQKWRKFCRFIRDEMTYLASWDYGREMIEANEWAPKADTLEAAAENVRTADAANLAKVAREAHKYLNGREWNADTAGNIAACFERHGFEVAAYEPPEEECPDCGDTDCHADPRQP